MSLKDRLQIILITYNRSQCVKETFEQFFFEGSPVANCDFLVQDNNSTDDTQVVVEEFAKKYPNIRYSRNPYNLGIAGNIAKAMEVADKDYVWIIGDDDIYDFSNWTEVEQAINNNEEIICITRREAPEDCENNIPYIVGQLTFISGGIYKTSLYNDTTIKNAFDNVYTLFPHIAPVLQFLNDGKRIYFVKKAIASNGFFVRPRHIDNSYTRGINDLSNVYNRTKTMHWAVGYANICSILKDPALKEAVFMHGLHATTGADEIASNTFCNLYNKEELLMQYIDIYMGADKNLKRRMKKFILKHYFDQGLFSIYRINSTIYIKLFNGLFRYTYKIPAKLLHILNFWQPETITALKKAFSCYLKIK